MTSNAPKGEIVNLGALTEQRPMPAPESPPARRTGWWPAVARFVIAVGLSAGLCLLYWSWVPSGLTGPTDVVGLPTFFAYDPMPPFWQYRLTVYVFPAQALLFFLLLARFGPLRVRREPAAQRPEVPLAPSPAMGSELDGGGRFRPGLALGVFAPAAVVGLAVAARGTGIDLTATACGVAYVLLVLGAAALWPRLPKPQWPRQRPATFADGLALVNGLGGAIVSVLALWFVSEHTFIQSAQGVRTYWPWLPQWLALPAIAGIIAWTVWQARKGRSAQSIERALLVVVVGAIALFLLYARIPSPGSWFQGYDDAQEMAGALLFDRGYFPWRDLLFIHGFLPDVLNGSVGFNVFADSIWGVMAGQTLLLVPFCYVGYYWLAAWLSKGNVWILGLIGVWAAGGWVPAQIRFIFVPLSLILLGAALSRRSRWWTFGLVFALFAQAVMAPETSFLAAPALACVVAADLVHRRPGASLWQALQRTRWCVVSGLALAAVLAVFLVLNDSLVPFIDYYIVFGPGHILAGAMPPSGIEPFHYQFLAASVVCVLLTLWVSVARIRRRRPWEPQDWVALAAAGFFALYGEKVLGRFDPAHVAQVLSVGIPLLLYWQFKVLSTVDGWARLWRPLRLTPVPVASLAVILLLAYSYQPQILTMPRTIAAGFHSRGEANAAYPRLSYTPRIVNEAALHDLETVLRHYAGDDQPVFDMTNSLGYLYFLLGRDPGTRFVHVSMAIPSMAQQLLIDDLERTKPPVVIYDATYQGLPIWDSVSNNVRHYEVAEYILRGWVPVLRTYGNTVMVRKDLVSPNLPVPRLDTPADTHGLWLEGRYCDWGYSPNFLRSEPAGKSVTLPVQPAGTGTVYTLTGYSAKYGSPDPAPIVLVSGGKAVGTSVVWLNRTDLGQRLGIDATSSLNGYSISAMVPHGTEVSAYTMDTDGVLHLQSGQPSPGLTSVTLLDGTQATVSSQPSTSVVGAVESVRQADKALGRIVVEPGMTLTGYSLATLSAGGQDLGSAHLAITDDLERINHWITAMSLAGHGADLPLRVGSCLQWYGYDPAKPLYVLQDPGVQVTSVTLSGVQPNSTR